MPTGDRPLLAALVRHLRTGTDRTLRSALEALMSANRTGQDQKGREHTKLTSRPGAVKPHLVQRHVAAQRMLRAPEVAEVSKLKRWR